MQVTLIIVIFIIILKLLLLKTRQIGDENFYQRLADKHAGLTVEVIDKTSDMYLVEKVFDDLSQKLAKSDASEYEKVAGFTKSQQAIYIIRLLEKAINMDGYHLFYINSSGQFADLAPEALQLVGAEQFADLTKKANRIFKYEIEGNAKADGDDSLDELDEEFCDLYTVEDLNQLQVDYIRKNKTEFIK